MTRLVIILGICYVASLSALLAVGVVPGTPWTMIFQVFVGHIMPLALVLVQALVWLEQRIKNQPADACVPVWIALGLAVVWFFDQTAHPAAKIALAVVTVGLLAAGPPRAWLKSFALSLVVLIVGFGAVWNLNYLAGKLLPESMLWDQSLLDFDVAFYRDWFGHDTGGQTGLFPVARHPIAMQFLQHAYMTYYVAIFAGIFVLLATQGDLTRFLSVLFGCFVVAAPIFLLMPSIGPFTFAPDSITRSEYYPGIALMMRQINEDYLALQDGGALQGFGYFIAMPSMHVAVGTVVQVFVWRCRPVFWMLLPVNVLLFLSTFLLGWHYVLDAPAGLAVAALTFGAAHLWDRLPFRARSAAPATTLDNPQVSSPDLSQQR